MPRHVGMLLSYVISHIVGIKICEHQRVCASRESARRKPDSTWHLSATFGRELHSDAPSAHALMVPKRR